jgi:hypothetical protein
MNLSEYSGVVAQNQFFADESWGTASDSPDESKEDDIIACLGFLVYLLLVWPAGE